jgi:hypothetical protein
MDKVISFLFYIFTLLSNFVFPKEDVQITMIGNITNPQQVIWVSDDITIFVTDGDIWEYSISQDTIKNIGTRKSNEFVGVDLSKQASKELIFCQIEHFVISSYDEFSTKFTLSRESEEEKKEFYFFETIRPIYIDEEKIIAVTAMDFLQEHFYTININTGEFREVENPKKKGFKLYVPEEIDFKNAYVRDSERYIIEDVFGNLYVFTKR